MKYALLLLLFSTAVYSAELVVGAGGKFSTVSEGMKALKPGDTLTILPGRYHESIEAHNLKDNLIRAKFPGSVLIHGDKKAPGFTLVPGTGFTYVAPWNDNVNAVNERDTLNIYLPAGNLRELEFNFGKWFHKDGKLYISTLDGAPPDKHDLTVSVLNGCGMRIWNPKNVTVEGLMFTGFYSHFKRDTWSGITGLQLQSPENCVIRNCTAFLNSNGITISGAETAIEHCTAYANGSCNPTSGGNIIGWSGKNNTIRDCVSFRRFPAGSDQAIGLRFYGNMQNCNIQRCVSFGEDGLNIKGSTPNCFLTDSYSERSINVQLSKNNIFGGINGYNSADISPLQKLKKADYPKHYADPENHDFRPLEKVKIGLPETIRSGEVILLEPGTFSALNIAADNVTVRTRGVEKRAVIAGGTISGANVKLVDLDFSAPLTISGRNAAVRGCTFDAKLTVTGTAVALTHNRFNVAPDLSGATGFRHSNVGNASGIDSLDDGTSLDALPVGPYRLSRKNIPVKITGPFIHSVSDTVANIEWWSSNGKATGELRYGTTPKCELRAGQPYSGGFFHSVTLSGLKPGTRYYFRVEAKSTPREHHSNEMLAQEDAARQRTILSSETGKFTTLRSPAAPRLLTATPATTISVVLDTARPGDTVQIKGGTYSETLMVRSGNITIRNAPGEKVTLEGNGVLQQGVVAENKPGVVIDGIFFHGFNGTAGILLNGGENIRVSRCFYDGRSDFYTPVFIRANSTANLTVENCFITRGFHGAHFLRCPGLTIRNCVWVNNQINHLYVHNLPEEKFFLKNNIFFDSIPMKIRNPLLGVWHLESLHESDNCFYVRSPADKRAVLSFHRQNNKLVSRQVSYPGYRELVGGRNSALFANPKCAALPEILVFKNPPDVNGAVTQGYSKESLEMNKLADTVEHQKLKNGFKPWDFSGWIATAPECKERNIGPEAQLFNQQGAPK